MKDFNIELVKECLEELASISSQKRLWLAEEGASEYSSFNEVYSQLFEDSALYEVLQTGHLGLSDRVANLLEQLEVQMLNFDDEKPPLDVILSSEMEEIRALSSSILQEPPFKKPSKS